MAGLDPAIQSKMDGIVMWALDGRRHAKGMLRMRGRP
jgi:hypothetical protein